MRSIVDCGTDLIWLSSDGVASLSLTEMGELQASQGALAGRPPMLSDDIDPLIKRINWQHASNAVAAFWDNKLYMAVPLDDAEVLRDELVTSTDVFTGNPGITFTAIPTIAGATYRFEFGANEQYLVNKQYEGNDYWPPDTGYSGYDAVTHQGGTLTAVEGGVYWASYSPNTDYTTCTASFKRVFQNVNNAILVYDFITRTWQGYDVIGGMDISEFRKYTYLGRERLFAWSSDGYGLLLEETFEDAIPEPYMDLLVTAKPAVGNTVRVNLGTSVAAINSSGNTATQWGCSTLAYATANLWTVSTYGYGTQWGTRWTAPNTAPRLISHATYGDAVRFVSTNGLLPVVTTTGSWALTRGATTQPIETSLTTRAYSNSESRWQRSLWLDVDVETWDPSMTFSITADGVAEETVLDTDRTKSRTAYFRPFNAAAWTETNANDDALEPYREDYSVRLGGEYAAGVYLGSGMWLGQHQTSTERFHLMPRASQAYQLTLTNSRGRCVLQGVSFEATPKAIPAGSSA